MELEISQGSQSHKKNAISAAAGVPYPALFFLKETVVFNNRLMKPRETEWRTM